MRGSSNTQTRPLYTQHTPSAPWREPQSFKVKTVNNAAGSFINKQRLILVSLAESLHLSFWELINEGLYLGHDNLEKRLVYIWFISDPIAVNGPSLICISLKILRFTLLRKLAAFFGAVQRAARPYLGVEMGHPPLSVATLDGKQSNLRHKWSS